MLMGPCSWIGPGFFNGDGVLPVPPEKVAFLFFYEHILHPFHIIQDSRQMNFVEVDLLAITLGFGE